jgi:hypothetical protein
VKCTVSVHVTPQNQAAETNPAPPPLTARDTRRMLSREDIEEIAGALPETTLERSPDGRPAFRVRGKLYGCQRDRRPDAVDPETGERLDDVMMFRVADEGVKQALLADSSSAWFTTPHFAGYPAILVRLSDLDMLTRAELEEVIVDAWLCQAPKRIAKAWLAERNEP